MQKSVNKDQRTLRGAYNFMCVCCVLSLLTVGRIRFYNTATVTDLGLINMRRMCNFSDKKSASRVKTLFGVDDPRTRDKSYYSIFFRMIRLRAQIAYSHRHMMYYFDVGAFDSQVQCKI